MTVVSNHAQQCTYSNDGNNYDLSPLTNNEVDYKLTIPDPHFTIECWINVCRPTVVQTCGSNSAGCEQWDSSGGKASLGQATPFTWHSATTSGTDGYGVMTQYTNGDAGRSMEITFICNENAGTGGPVYVNEIPNLQYNFQWATQYACPTNFGSGGGGGGLSGGSILLIILLCVTVVYIVGGLLLNKFYRQKEGMEMFPNVEFWLQIPGLVKDGVVFSYHGIRGLIQNRGGGGDGTYQSIPN